MTAIDSRFPWGSATPLASAWLNGIMAWQLGVWGANFEAMRLMQQALRPDTWKQLGEQWAYMQRNGPTPG